MKVKEAFKYPEAMSSGQPVHSAILTPGRWKGMGEVKAGDLVVAIARVPHQIIQQAIYPVEILSVTCKGVREIYRITLASGATARFASDEPLDYSSMYEVEMLTLAGKTNYAMRDCVSSVQLVGEEESRCILIDHPGHLYVTNDYIIAHDAFSCEDND